MRKAVMLFVLFAVVAAMAQRPRQSVAIYMAGVEPSALRGAHKIIGSELAKAFSATNAYTAADRTQEALNIIEGKDLATESGEADDKQVLELGKQLKVSFLCVAEINETKVKGKYILQARFYNTETAQVLHVVSKSGAMRDVYRLVEISQSAAQELVSGGGR